MIQGIYFHVIGGIPPNSMHDVVEGLQYAVKEILKVYLIENKLFTLDELNNRIVLFDYGYLNASNNLAKILRKKLLHVSSDHNLKQHGKLNIFIIKNAVCFIKTIIDNQTHVKN